MRDEGRGSRGEKGEKRREERERESSLLNMTNVLPCVGRGVLFCDHGPHLVHSLMVYL